MRIAALYVVYNPDWEYFFRSVESLADSVDAVYVYANSKIEKKKEDKLHSIKDNLIILGDGTNVGIAKALNELSLAAVDGNNQWAVTMDQDSLMPSYFIDEYKKFLNEHSNEKIGIVCPNYTLGKGYQVEKKKEVVELDKTITSGACMGLDVYKEVGGFRDDLFIDAVDTEYSWKVRLYGYKVIRLMWLVLEHHIGENPFDLKLFGKRILGVDNHNYIRCYYITRNTLLINSEYKKLLPESVKNNRKALKLLIKVLLFEKDKIKKIRSIYYGVIDYKKNRLGKYNY